MDIKIERNEGVSDDQNHVFDFTASGEDVSVSGVIQMKRVDNPKFASIGLKKTDISMTIHFSDDQQGPGFSHVIAAVLDSVYALSNKETWPDKPF